MYYLFAGCCFLCARVDIKAISVKSLLMLQVEYLFLASWSLVVDFKSVRCDPLNLNREGFD